MMFSRQYEIVNGTLEEHTDPVGGLEFSRVTFSIFSRDGLRCRTQCDDVPLELQNIGPNSHRR